MAQRPNRLQQDHRKTSGEVAITFIPCVSSAAIPSRYTVLPVTCETDFVRRGADHTWWLGRTNYNFRQTRPRTEYDIHRNFCQVPGACRSAWPVQPPQICKVKPAREGELTSPASVARVLGSEIGGRECEKKLRTLLGYGELKTTRPQWSWDGLGRWNCSMSLGHFSLSHLSQE